MNHDVEQLFANSEPQVFDLYSKIIVSLNKIGKINIEPKKTSLHINNRVAFLGIHPKKNYLELNIVTSTPISSPRVIKFEQVSKNRYHNRVRLTEAGEIDDELIQWLTTAYLLLA